MNVIIGFEAYESGVCYRCKKTYERGARIHYVGKLAPGELQHVSIKCKNA